METVVQKCDGSAVTDCPKLEDGNEQIVQRVQKGETVCTVVSVMGGTTEKLMVLAQRVTDFTPKYEVDPLLSSGELIHMALLSMVIQKQRPVNKGSKRNELGTRGNFKRIGLSKSCWQFFAGMITE